MAYSIVIDTVANRIESQSIKGGRVSLPEYLFGESVEILLSPSQWKKYAMETAISFRVSGIRWEKWLVFLSEKNLIDGVVAK